jgi:threonine dehydrogenase-like Zn-dependent dehydrogenase
MQTSSIIAEGEARPARVLHQGSMRRSTSMRAAVLTAPGHFEMRTFNTPEPAADQVLVRLEGCGVCGSNLPPWEGREWFKYPFAPGAPGHEGWGTVEAIGATVMNVRPGDRVAMLSYQAFAEYDMAEAGAVVSLPGALRGKPFPGEALGCAFNVFERCDIRRGHTVAIVGVGFLGAVLTSLAASAGAEVIAITRRPFALEVAHRYGASQCIPMEDHWKIIERVRALTAGRGCDRVIEAVGAAWPLDLAAELTRERGKLIIAGYHQDGPRQVNMQLWNWRGLDVINAHERDSAVYVRGMRAAVDAVATGTFDPTPLYTHTFPLDRMADAFTAIQRREGPFMKALVTV